MNSTSHMVDEVLQAINKQPNSAQIKKLLFLKLEMDVNKTRCVIGDTDNSPRPDVIDLE